MNGMFLACRRRLFGIELFGHLTIADGVESGIFFAMTGWHALHVLSGLLLDLCRLEPQPKGKLFGRATLGCRGDSDLLALY